MALYEKLCAYAFLNNVELNFDPFEGNVMIRDDGDGKQYVAKWNINFKQPTMEDLNKISDSDLTKYKEIEVIKSLEKEYDQLPNIIKLICKHVKFDKKNIKSLHIL